MYELGSDFLKYKNDLKSDLIYIFKKLYEREEINKREYSKAIDIIVQNSNRERRG